MDNIGSDSFEAAFATRLRYELDSMHIWVPAAIPMSRRARPAALASATALAVGCALVLGAVAAFASGSPNPKVWIREAEQTIGIPPTGSEPSQEGAAPASTATPEPTEASSPAGGEKESTSPTAPEQESPNPESPAAVQPPEPVEHSPTGSPGDG